jgi:hypothetical protein
MVVGWWKEYLSRRGIAAQQAMCGSVRYRDAETAPLSLPLAAPLPPNCIAEMICNILSRPCDLTVHQSFDVNDFLEHFD